MPGVNILRIGLGFTPRLPQRLKLTLSDSGPLRLKLVRFVAPSFTVLRSVHIGIPRPVPFWCGRFGHDVDDPTHRAITIARAPPGRGSHRYDRSSPAGTQLVSPRESRSPRQPYRTELRLVTGLPSTSTNVFSGPMPRISICRLLPRRPLVELPVRVYPGLRTN